MIKQTLVAIVENKPGVLNRVASLFRRRNFNIDSLNVGRTENPAVSRMTIVVDSTEDEARLIEANLWKLVNVIDVQDVTNENSLFRELALLKVDAPPEKRAEIVSLASIFQATVEDVAPDCVIVQLAATPTKVDSLIELLSPCGIVELLRTGAVAMTRGKTEGLRRQPNAEAQRVIQTNGHHN